MRPADTIIDPAATGTFPQEETQKDRITPQPDRPADPPAAPGGKTEEMIRPAGKRNPSHDPIRRKTEL